MFGIFTRRQKIKDIAYLLFTDIVAQARNPVFYRDWGVPDTLDGRFDLITLHTSLVIDRLESTSDHKNIRLLARYIQEVLFENMDMSLREIGVGDMSVGKKVKAMAEAFYGRKAAYQKALQAKDVAGPLKSALIRNIYRGNPPEDVNLDVFASYIDQQRHFLAGQSDEDLLAGKLQFENSSLN